MDKEMEIESKEATKTSSEGVTPSIYYLFVDIQKSAIL